MGETDDGAKKHDLLNLTAAVVAAVAGKHALSSSDLTKLIVDVHAAFRGLGSQTEGESVEPLKPAISIRKSVTPDFLICLEDGRKFKSLKRHLRVSYGLTPDSYRQKWGLPSDYPMVAPGYSATRSSLALSRGLGRKTMMQGAPAPTAKAKRARKSAA